MDLQTTALLRALRRRARKHGLNIVFNRKPVTGFILVNKFTNIAVSYPSILTLEDVEQWLDELDERVVNNG